MLGRRALLLLLPLALAACKAPAKKGPMDGGEIGYSVNGISRGKLIYAPGVRREDASAVGDWLREQGWFITRPENESRVTGKAQGSFGTGAAGRGSGEPLAKVNLRPPNGLEVIVYASQQAAESSDVGEFAGKTVDELKKRTSKSIRFVIRSETKKGEGLSWVDTTWDSDQEARSNGK